MEQAKHLIVFHLSPQGDFVPFIKEENVVFTQ